MSPTVRCSFLYLSALALAFAAGCGGSPAASDAGVDSGPTPDAGVDAGVDAGGDAGVDAGVDAGMDAGSDAGMMDAGPDAGSPLVTLQIAANPNNVLSAVATVGWTGAIASVYVTYQVSGAASTSTPTHTVESATNPMNVPVLGLAASTTYSFVAVGTDGTGNTFSSAPVSLTTGALPAGVTSYVVADGGTPTPGYTLVARLPAPSASAQDYVTINDSTTGAPVWYLPVTPGLGGDFQKQPDGTYTIGVSDPAHVIQGLPETTVIYQQVDVLGNTVHSWTAPDVPAGTAPASMNTADVTVLATDDHDIRIQPNGDALLMGFVQQTMDLSAQGGMSNATVASEVLERVTTGGTVTFAWNAFDYLDTANIDPVSTKTTGSFVDFTHANAIDVTTDGNYLLSLRNLSQVLKIDATTGDIIWKLGGKDSDFKFMNDPFNGFSCQHAARELPNGDIIMFDDGDGHTPAQSRAAEYALDTTAMTATLVWSAEDMPTPLYSFILGNAQRLSNGHTIVTYGTTLHIQEVDAMGNVVWDMTDPTHGFGLYRAFHLDSLY